MTPLAALPRSDRAEVRLAAIVCAIALGAGTGCRDEDYVKVDRIEITHTATLQSLTPEQQKLFRPSIVLWKPVEEDAILSWEVIATARILAVSRGLGEGVIGGPVPPIRIAACDNRNADTNQPFDPPLVTASWAPFFPGSFRQCGHQNFPPGTYPYDSGINPVAFASCVDLPSSCPEQTAGNFPYCQRTCAVRADTDSVFAFPYPPGMTNAPPFGKIYLSPAYKVVSTIRALGRRMKFDHRNDGADWDVWTWAGEPTADGTLFENFSPALFISKVRAFLPAPTAVDPEAKRYLTLYRFEPQDTQIECAPGANDATQISDQDCPSLIAFTPTFSKERPEDIGQTITWQLTLRPGDPGNQGLDTSSPVYVEFTLGNSMNRRAGPRLSSATLDLGSTPAGVPIDNRSLVLENPFAGGKWRLERIELIGRDAAQFSVDVAGLPPAGRDLWPSASLPIGIHLRTSDPGSKEAAIAFRLTDPDGGAAAVSAGLTARVLPLATLTLEPDHLDFSRQPDSPLPWRTAFLIANDGALPLSRQGILLEGPDASNFHVFASDGIHDPPALATVDSGQSERFVVEYCPRQSNHAHHAEVHIYASNGAGTGLPVEAFLPLTGNAPPRVVVCLERAAPPPVQPAR